MAGCPGRGTMPLPWNGSGALSNISGQTRSTMTEISQLDTIGRSGDSSGEPLLPWGNLPGEKPSRVRETANTLVLEDLLLNGDRLRRMSIAVLTEVPLEPQQPRRLLRSLALVQPTGRTSKNYADTSRHRRDPGTQGSFVFAHPVSWLAPPPFTHRIPSPAD